MIEKLLLNKLKKQCSERNASAFTFSVNFDDTKKVVTKFGDENETESKLDSSTYKIVIGLLKSKIGIEKIDFLTGVYSATENTITLTAYFEQDGQKKSINTLIK